MMLLDTAQCTAQRSRKSLVLALVLTLLLLVLPLPVMAKDLSNRLGIGYINQFSHDVPAIAIQYYPGPDVGFSLAIGVDTERDNSRFGAMGKLYRIIFQEDNMNFYMGAGGGVISHEQPGTSENGFELSGFAGTEFFFSGLENLGFSFEAGVGVISMPSGVRFRTFGDHPLRAGIMFYF